MVDFSRDILRLRTPSNPTKGAPEMKTLVMIAALFAVPALVHAQAAKSCDDLKAEIAKKIEANGVKTYTLDVVDKDAQADGKVVGTCGGGTKKIVYTRGGSSAESSAPAAQAPAPDANKQ
jgi:hypothetical protein